MSAVSCNGDPDLNLKLYQGNSAALRVEHPERDPVYCYNFDFDKMTCVFSEELEREVNDLRWWIRNHCD
jgi:hypothetical protein